MPNKFAEAIQRNFDQMSTPKLSDDARKAVIAAFEAMSTWREEIVNNSEKNSEQVIEKMAEAARELGWPDQIVDATRMQMEAITKMQIQTMDHMMDTWEESGGCAQACLRSFAGGLRTSVCAARADGASAPRPP